LTAEERSNLIIPCLHDETRFQTKSFDDGELDTVGMRIGADPEKLEKLKQLEAQKVMPLPKVRSP
jgi:hypothetical protein